MSVGGQSGLESKGHRSRSAESMRCSGHSIRVRYGQLGSLSDAPDRHLAIGRGRRLARSAMPPDLTTEKGSRRMGAETRGWVAQGRNGRCTASICRSSKRRRARIGRRTQNPGCTEASRKRAGVHSGRSCAILFISCYCWRSFKVYRIEERAFQGRRSKCSSPSPFWHFLSITSHRFAGKSLFSSLLRSSGCSGSSAAWSPRLCSGLPRS